MKRVIFFILFSYSFCFGQFDTVIYDMTELDTSIVLQGCISYEDPERCTFDYLRKFVDANVQYPKECHECYGKVWVEFIIELTGDISQPKVLKGVTPGMNDEAIRLVKLFPRFKPITFNGKRVRCKYRMPIIFSGI